MHEETVDLQSTQHPGGNAGGAASGRAADAAADTVVMSSTGRTGEPAEVVLPKDLGAVRLVRLVGRGGMGEVHLGRHKFLHRDVAVKFMLSAAGDETDPAFRRFIEGASAAAAARHPGLTAILHADVASGVPYLVMEYVEGPTLADVITRGGPLPEAAALVAMQQVTEAVAALHERDIVHRDIKPSNVLLSVDGQVHVTDFGLTLARPPGSYGATQAGVAGTAAYMAPECFEGEFSARSDVYALGVMGFELLTGEAPFGGSLLEARRRHREEPLPVEQLRQAGVCEELIDLLERATYKNRVFRYKSAAHLQRALERLVTEDVRRAGIAELQRRAVAGGGRADASEGAAGELDRPSTSYFERLSSLADRQLRTAATRATMSETPAAAPVLKDGEGPPLGATTDEPQAAAASGLLTHRREANRPERRNAAARRVLSLGACPQCGCDLSDLPRRYRCPRCSFLYDEGMFALTQSPAARTGRRSPPSLALVRIALVLLISVLVALLFLVSVEAGIAGAIVAAIVVGSAWLLGRLSGGRGEPVIIFTSRGLAQRRGCGPFDPVPFSEFVRLEFAEVAAPLDGQLENRQWRLTLHRDCGCGLLYLLSGNRLLDESRVEGVFSLTAREAALVRNEVRRRLKAAAELWQGGGAGP